MKEPAGRPIQIGKKVLFLLENALDDFGSRLPFQLPCLLCGGTGIFFENARPHVASLVNAMAKSHDLFLACQGVVNPAFSILGAAGLAEKVHDLLVGATVQ